MVQWLDLQGASLGIWPDWLGMQEQETLWPWLLQDISWQQQSICLFGRRHLQPRLTAWFADEPYRYSGLVLPATPWPAKLAELRERVASSTGHGFNSVLLNYYRDGNDHIGWHRDNEPELGPAPAVASLSLGAQRRFVMRRRDDHACRHECWLAPGTLLLMGPGMQAQWQHALPKARHISTPRINLTFRFLLPRR